MSAERTRRLYGKLTDGRVYYRGIELRRHDYPLLFKRFQHKLLDIILEADTAQDIVTDQLRTAIDYSKEKRWAVSKHGKWCHKGYYYGYAFSSQGKKYVRWMRDSKPLEDALGAVMIGRVASDLPREISDPITAFRRYRASMRYKGPSRGMQEFGPLAFALPRVLAKLNEATARCDELEKERSRLGGIVEKHALTVKEQGSRIRDLEAEKTNLLAHLKEKDEVLQVLLEPMVKLIRIGQVESQTALECDEASRSITKAYERMIRDLAEVLAVRHFEAAVTIVKSIEARNIAKMIPLAEAHLKTARLKLEQAKELQQTI